MDNTEAKPPFFVYEAAKFSAHTRFKLFFYFHAVVKIDLVGKLTSDFFRCTQETIFQDLCWQIPAIWET